VHTTKGEIIDLKGLLARDADFVRAAVAALVQAALEAEMTEAIGAAKGERSETRRSCRSGYYSRYADTTSRPLRSARSTSRSTRA
jgi:transposase-like protein